MKTFLGESTRAIVALLLGSSFFLSGCGGSDQFVFTNPVFNAPSVLPLAVDDGYTSIGNTLLKVTAVDGVLQNDTLNGGEIVSFDASSAQGGSVAVLADGSFEYTPPNNLSNVNDTFTYTLATAAGQSSATVTVALNNFGRYVDNTAAPGGDGTLGAPFTTIQAAVDASAGGDTVFVFASPVAYNEDVTLATGVSIQGEGAGFSIDNGLARGDFLGSVVLPAGDRPRVTGEMTLASNTAVSGFQIEPPASVQAVLGTGISDITISDNLIINDQSGIVLMGVGGVSRIERNEFQGILSLAVFLDNTTEAGEAQIHDNTFTVANLENPSAILLSASDARYSCSVTGNTSGGDGSLVNFLNHQSFGNGSDGHFVTVSNNTVSTVGGFMTSVVQRGGDYVVQGNIITGSGELQISSSQPGTQSFRCLVGGSLSGQGNICDDLDTFGGVCSIAAIDQEADIQVVNNRWDVLGSPVAVQVGSGTIVLSGNDQRNSANSSLLRAAGTSGTTLVACRDNNLDTLGLIEVTAFNPSNLCAAISGNQVNEISLTEEAGATLEVEGLLAPEGGPLSTLNNGATVLTTGTPTSVNLGSCGI